ncbi:nucleotidyltransferase family protein [Acidovorax sp. SUPP3334]|uniref:nucleotidyltransferase family protein n=1 Tax=Acidovorax sp. SUPP3334 TaxID=2920881 RepID=UPI0023DE30C7|nr:nucleotidyltransferase family protein [Acidovorax sp. SUPP3334]GKT21257.1 nucleotidyltransferase family protein [Acidovorax sp. SUPP3334]
MDPSTPDAVLRRRFVSETLQNPHNAAILERLPLLALPDAWGVAGCLFQTVWNLQAGLPPTAHIKDYDVFYFDGSDLSEAAERQVQARVAALFADLPITLEAKNQARVHLWYEQWFGHPYSALRSSRHGIERFLVPCTCVGLQPGATAEAAPVLHAPYGLEELYAGILRPNPQCPHFALFQAKARSYRDRWHWLVIEDEMDLPA